MYRDRNSVFQVSVVGIGFVLFNSVINILPLKLPVKWYNEKIEAPGQFRRMDRKRMEPTVPMGQNRQEQTDP